MTTKPNFRKYSLKIMTSLLESDKNLNELALVCFPQMKEEREYCLTILCSECNQEKKFFKKNVSKDSSFFKVFIHPKIKNLDQEEKNKLFANKKNRNLKCKCGSRFIKSKNKNIITSIRIDYSANYSSRRFLDLKHNLRSREIPILRSLSLINYRNNQYTFDRKSFMESFLMPFNMRNNDFIDQWINKFLYFHLNRVINGKSNPRNLTELLNELYRSIGYIDREKLNKIYFNKGVKRFHLGKNQKLIEENLVNLINKCKKFISGNETAVSTSLIKTLNSLSSKKTKDLNSIYKNSVPEKKVTLD
jgi:hypothetical protein